MYTSTCISISIEGGQKFYVGGGGGYDDVDGCCRSKKFKGTNISLKAGGGDTPFYMQGGYTNFTKGGRGEQTFDIYVEDSGCDEYVDGKEEDRSKASEISNSWGRALTDHILQIYGYIIYYR